MKMWKINKEKTQEDWLEVYTEDNKHSAIVKWDGCIHYYDYCNDAEPYRENKSEDVDYMHICDIDQEIAYLQELRKVAEEFYKDHFYQAFYKPEV
jgi:hypothetical protein